MKFLKKYSLGKRMNLLSAVLMVPLTVLILYLLVSLINFSNAYSQSVRNITVIKDYSLSFKADLDYSMYRVIIGNLDFSLLDAYAENGEADSSKIRNPYSMIHEMRNSLTNQEKQSGKEGADLLR